MSGNIINVSLKLTTAEVAIVLNLLDKATNGREAARITVPLMDKIEAQTQDAVELIAEQRREEKRKMEAAQKAAEEKAAKPVTDVVPEKKPEDVVVD